MAGNVSEFVGREYSPEIRGGNFATEGQDAKIYFSTELVAGSEFDWAYVGFRAARSVAE
jgi:hypothetical protein